MTVTIDAMPVFGFVYKSCACPTNLVSVPDLIRAAIASSIAPAGGGILEVMAALIRMVGGRKFQY